MERLDEWCSTGQIRYREDELHHSAAVAPEALALGEGVAAEIRKQRVLALMLGDTSMGMINGYFGPRLLSKHGFAEHKVDQAWLPDRARKIEARRVEDAFRFVKDKGVDLPLAREGRGRLHRGRHEDAAGHVPGRARPARRVQGRLPRLAVPARPLARPAAQRLLRGPLNSTCRPESNGDLVITATEADQGNLVPMELMKRLLKAKGLHQAVMFHDVRWGGEHDGRWLWVLLNSGSCGAYAFNHDPETLKGVHSYRQPAGYFPIPGGTFAGESLPGAMTWARAYIKDDVAWMDVGRGEVVALPPKVRDAWWEGTTRQWPFMAADLVCSKETVMAHYLCNHVAVAYGDVFGEMVAASQELGFRVRVMAR